MLTLVRPRLPVRRISQAEVKRHGWCRRNVYAEPKLGQPESGNSDPFDHELRYLLSRGEMRRFLDAIAARTAIEIYDPARPISYTRTTYLDTDDLSYFRTGDGAPARRLRVREYAIAATPKDAPVLSGVAFVELKEHDGPARRKVRLAASPAEIAQLLAEREVGPSLRHDRRAGELARELALPTMAPRLATWYRRLCLTADGRRVRITLDENLTFCRPQPIGDAGALAAPREREVIAAFPGAGPGDQALRRDAVLARPGARVPATGGTASPSSGWG